MATEAQSTANRRNAQLSTGPRTQAGRARSSRNALKSGIYAESEIIPGEDPAELAQLTAEYYESIQPQGRGEAALVDQVIRADWKLRRISRAEADVWNMSMRNDRESNLQKGLPEDQDLYIRAVEDNKDAFDRIFRYQASVARILRNGLDCLLRLRKTGLLTCQNEPNPRSVGSEPEAPAIPAADNPPTPNAPETAETNPIPTPLAPAAETPTDPLSSPSSSPQPLVPILECRVSHPRPPIPDPRLSPAPVTRARFRYYNGQRLPISEIPKS
jgi:hypothetical protein